MAFIERTSNIVLVSLELSAGGPLSLRQFSIEKLLGESVVFHSEDMPGPAQLVAIQEVFQRHALRSS